VSGRPLVELRAADARVVIDADAGGRLASFVVHGVERLVTSPAPGDRGIGWGSFLMAPWVGRLADATLAWDGASHRLPPDHGRHAIHGLVLGRPWVLIAADDSACDLEIALGPAGWPFGGHLRQSVRLTDGALRIEARLRADETAMPAALGWHPWFRRPTGGDMAVAVDAAEVLELGPDLVPTGRRIAVDPTSDLRSSPLLGDRRLDTVYVDARGPARVTWPDLDLSIQFGRPLATVVVYSPPGAVCVEPQTSWPNAVALAAAGVAGTGLVSLAPGGVLRASMTWRWGPT